MSQRRAGVRAHWDRLVLLLGAVVAPALVLAYFNRNSGFVWDDLKNFRQAQLDGLSLAHLGEPTSGHFAPGHRLGDWLVQTVSPLNFPFAQFLLLAGFVVSLMLFHHILLELFRPGYGPALMTLIYGASFAHVGVTQWWAAGLDRVPATILSFISVLGYLRYYSTRSRLWLAISVAAVPAGLLFYVKPVFVPVYLVLLRVLVLESDQPLRESLASTLRDWKVWLLYAVPTGLSLAVYVAHYPTELNQDPSFLVFLRYLNDLWFRVVTPSFFGIFIPQMNHSWVAGAAVVAVQLALIALVAWTLRHRPGAWRGWTFFAVAFLVNALAVGLTRVGAFSARDIAYTVYFNLEMAYLFALGLAFVLLQRRRGPQPGRLHPPPESPNHWRWVAAGAAGYLALFASAAHQLNDSYIWTGAVARDYTDTVAAGIDRLNRSGADYAVVDGRVPKSVVPQFLAPYNGLSEVLPLIDDAVAFDPEGRQLLEVGADGRFSPVTRRSSVAAPTAELVRHGALAWVNTGQRLTEEGVCFRTSNRPGGVVLTLPTAIEGRLFAGVRYTTGARAEISVAALPGGSGDNSPEGFRHAVLSAGIDEARVFPLPASSVQRLVLVLGARSDICLRHLEVGWLGG